MRWSVGAPLVIVSLLASSFAFADTTMLTTHGTVAKAPVLPPKVPIAKAPAPFILKAAKPVAPPPKPIAPIVLNGAKASNSPSSGPGRTANVIADRRIVLHRQDVPKTPGLATSITLSKQTR